MLPLDVLSHIFDSCSHYLTKDDWFTLRCVSAQFKELIDSKITFGIFTLRGFDKDRIIGIQYLLGTKTLYVNKQRFEFIKNLWNTEYSSLLLNLKCVFITFPEDSNLSAKDHETFMNFLSQVPARLFTKMKRLRWEKTVDVECPHLRTRFFDEIIVKMPAAMELINIPFAYSNTSVEATMKALLKLKPKNLKLNLHWNTLESFCDLLPTVERTNLAINFCGPMNNANWSELVKQCEQIQKVYKEMNGRILLTLQLFQCHNEMPPYRDCLHVPIYTEEPIPNTPFKMRFTASTYSIHFYPVLCSPSDWNPFNVHREQSTHLVITASEDILVVHLKKLDGMGQIVDGTILLKNEKTEVWMEEPKLNIVIFKWVVNEPHYKTILENWLLHYNTEGCRLLCPANAENILAEKSPPATIQFEERQKPQPKEDRRFWARQAKRRKLIRSTEITVKRRK